MNKFLFTIGTVVSLFIMWNIGFLAGYSSGINYHKSRRKEVTTVSLDKWYAPSEKIHLRYFEHSLLSGKVDEFSFNGIVTMTLSPEDEIGARQITSCNGTFLRE